jgi:hypothetical protein
MAAHLEEPTGKAAGRVTITSTLTSLILPFFAVLVVVVCALLHILSAETAGAVVLGILATAGLTTGTVFSTAKNTPTDQTKVVYSSGGYDQVVPEVAPVAVASAPTGSTALATADPLETSSNDAAARMRAELQGGVS